MVSLNLPACEFLVRKKNNKPYILDEVRKKYVLLTSEEWVRQHFVRFLVLHKNCPSGLISLEKTFIQNDISRRSDIIVYNRSAEALMLVECKAPEVSITQQVFDQALSYNLVVKAPYLLVSNGLNHFCIFQDFKNNSWKFLEEIPNFQSLDITGIK